jgi:hypothetical protein
MRFTLLILVATFLSSKIAAQQTLTYNDARFLYELKMDSVLTADKVNYDCVISSISMTRKADGKVIQVITPPENTGSCGMPPDQIFIIQDMNFDGFNDFRILQFLPAAPNEPYYFWMFDTTTQLFRRDTTLEDITSPNFDNVKKEVVSSWRASCCEHGSSTYKYIHGRITLVDEFSEVQDDEKATWTHKKRIKGKMKVVERGSEKFDEKK